MSHSKPSAVFSALRLRGIKPALERVVQLGMDLSTCLEGSGITIEQLSAPEDLSQGISLEQEFKLYDNILRESDDPHIGLELGKAYRIESLGILGYALMSAKTFEDSIKIAITYSPLTLSYFRPVMVKQEDFGGIALAKQYEIPDHLLQVFSDRAVTAAIRSQTSSTDLHDIYKIVRLMHTDEANREKYEQAFGCSVEFGHFRNEILIDREVMTLQLPKQDAAFSKRCIDQCKRILISFENQSDFVVSVKELIMSEPSYFPKATEVAKRLGCTPRTLRRKLAQEGSHYQTILNEVRSELAKKYLASNLSIDQISELLGFSEAAAFSNAFKTWESLSPSDYRQSHQFD